MSCQVCHGGEAESQLLSFGCILRSHIETHLNLQLQVSSLLVCHKCCDLLHTWDTFYNKSRANLASVSHLQSSANSLTGVSILQEEIRKLNASLSTQHNDTALDTDNWREPAEAVVIKEEPLSPQPIQSPLNQDKDDSSSRRRSLRSQAGLFTDLGCTNGDLYNNRRVTRQRHETTALSEKVPKKLDPRVKECRVVLDRSEVEGYLHGMSSDVTRTTQRTSFSSQVERHFHRDVPPGRSKRRRSLTSQVEQCPNYDVPVRITRQTSLSAQTSLPGVSPPEQSPYGSDIFVMQPQENGPNCSPSIALNQLTCRLCLQSFNATYQLDEHIKCHASPLPQSMAPLDIVPNCSPSISLNELTCRLCLQSFNTSYQLEEHIKCHHALASPRPHMSPLIEQSEPLVPEVAEQQFKVPKLMIFQCSDCDICFTNASQFQCHKQFQH